MTGWQRIVIELLAVVIAVYGGVRSGQVQTIDDQRLIIRQKDQIIQDKDKTLNQCLAKPDVVLVQ